MASVLDETFFRAEAAAYARIEGIVWPNGPICVHRGERNRNGLLKGNARCHPARIRSDRRFRLHQ